MAIKGYAAFAVCFNKRGKMVQVWGNTSIGRKLHDSFSETWREHLKNEAWTGLDQFLDNRSQLAASTAAQISATSPPEPTIEELAAIKEGELALISAQQCQDTFLKLRSKGFAASATSKCAAQNCTCSADRLQAF